MNIKNISSKYNWWTHENDKENISLESRIEYILKYGNFDESLYIFKNYFDLIPKIFIERVKNDITISEKHKNFIAAIIKHKLQKIG